MSEVKSRSFRIMVVDFAQEGPRETTFEEINEDLALIEKDGGHIIDVEIMKTSTYDHKGRLLSFAIIKYFNLVFLLWIFIK